MPKHEAVVREILPNQIDVKVVDGDEILSLPFRPMQGCNMPHPGCLPGQLFPGLVGWQAGPVPALFFREEGG